MMAEESRKRVLRDKRSKPYKSDPFCAASQNGGSPPTPPSIIYENTADGLSKTDVLTFLHNVTHSEDISRSNSMKSLDGAPKMVAVSFVYFFLLLKTTPMLD
jgi:hypothetical protein